MPFAPTDKKSRSLTFARQHGEAKAVKRPPDSQERDFYLDTENLAYREVENVGGMKMSVSIFIEIEKYKPWPDCPWAEPYRVIMTKVYNQADLDSCYGGYCPVGPDFTMFGSFKGTREQALASASNAFDTERTF